MSAETSSDWIEGEFEGIYSGDRRSAAAPGDPARPRLFGFELESGVLRESLPCDPPGPAADGDEVIRQGRVRRVSISLAGDAAAAREAPLFDVHVSDWQLKHPAEADDRAYGTIVGTIRARLRPESALPEHEFGAPSENSQTQSTAPSKTPRSQKPRSKNPGTQTPAIEVEDPAASVHRFLFGIAIVVVAFTALVIGFACGPRVAAIWGAPALAALLVRRGLGGGLALPGAIGAVLFVVSLALISTPLQIAWQDNCWPALEAWRLVGIGLPVVAAAALRARWPVFLLGTLWTLVVCSGCSALGDGSCAVAPTTPAAAVSVEEPAGIGARDAPVARTDSDGRWPVMPQVAFPHGAGGAFPSGGSGSAAGAVDGSRSITPGAGGSGSAGGEGGRLPAGGGSFPAGGGGSFPAGGGGSFAADGGGSAALAPGNEPAPQSAQTSSGSEPGKQGPPPLETQQLPALSGEEPAQAGPNALPQTGTNASPQNALEEPESPGRAGGRADTSTEGGWVSPDHRRAAREAILISIEQANRTPELFFASEGSRRVYVPTDPIFDDASARLRTGAELVLARVAALLSHPSRPRVVLEIHSDSAGALENQVALSDRRAAALRDWLIDRGHVDPQRFELFGVGGARPLVPPDGDYSAQQPNRRIEIRLVDSQQASTTPQR